MSTKLVTGYWMGIHNRPYVGAAISRQERYLGSLISTCQNFTVPVVCYTQKSNLNDLIHIKQEYNLSNLEIKIRELDDMRYSTKFKDIVNRKTPEEIEHLTGRPPEVMWGKLDVLLSECTDDVNYVYWIDVGLQSNQIMPYKYCPHIPQNIKKHSDLPPELFTTQFKQFNFSGLLNQSLLNKLERKVKDKIILLCSSEPQCTYYQFSDYSLNTFYPNNANYPIAGFFGGDKNIVIEFCHKFYEAGEVHLENNIIDFEQSVMKHAMDIMSREKLLLDYWFNTHAISEYLHYNAWTPELNVQKPLYVAFENIFNDL